MTFLETEFSQGDFAKDQGRRAGWTWRGRLKEDKNKLASPHQGQAGYHCILAEISSNDLLEDVIEESNEET